MSNGSSELSFRNKEFQITKRIIVRDGHTTYTKINELEYANGYIWANVWQSNYILKIDLETGDVLSRYDLSELAKINSKRPKHTVLNGLAYDEKSDAFWVTGKFWPRRYLIRFE